MQSRSFIVFEKVSMGILVSYYKKLQKAFPDFMEFGSFFKYETVKKLF